MTQGFPGLPIQLFEFLEELRLNNNREWFNANKETYRSYVVSPVIDFIEAMAPGLEKISDCYVADPRPNGGSMFRIYRDTRFSKNKQPYKTNVGCQFRHSAGKDAHAPGFYVHLEPGQVFFGGGIWKPPGPALANIREAISEKHEHWTRITTNKKFTQRFGDIQGDRLKRPPKGYATDHPAIEDLKYKSFFVMQEDDETLATSPDFIKEVNKAFKTAAPFMEFLTSSQDLPFNLK